jgi:hypothetical protein
VIKKAWLLFAAKRHPYNNIGLVYQNKKNFKEAKYFKKGLAEKCI